MTDSIEDSEQLSTRVKNPRLWISLTDESNDHELEKTEETRVGGDGEASRVLLKNRGLQHEPAGPGQAMANKVDATQGPVLAIRIPQRNKSRCAWADLQWYWFWAVYGWPFV